MKIANMEVAYVQHCGSDLSVVNAARVSFNKLSSELDDKDIRLISYLASHGHISPFHHAFITLRVKAPVFVARQLVKHKFMPWNEVSRRYVEDEPEVYWPEVWRTKAANVKQGSSEQPSKFMEELQWNGEEYGITEQSGDEIIFNHVNHCVGWYKDMVANGVAPEQARMVLPQNIMTEWHWSGTLSAWASMLNLRLKPDAQKETRDVAQMAHDIILPLFPHSLAALSWMETK